MIDEIVARVEEKAAELNAARAAEAVGLAKVSEKHSAASLRNGGAPSVVLTHAGKLTPEARKSLEGSWRKAYGGESRGGAAVLDGGMDVKPLQLTSEQVQLMEQRRFQVGEIARWFDVPPHMIGDLERATFSNIEQQSIEFATLRLRPDLVAWEQAIRRDLIVARERYFAEFALDGLLRGDSAARSAYYQGGIQNGWLARNEARLLENLNPLPGLDEPLVPQNMAPAGAALPEDGP
jgi:HK97 family phage portal protein